MTDALLWLAVGVCVVTLLWLLAWTAGHLPRGHRPSGPMRKGPPPRIERD